MNRKLKGFSLAELLISLLIISIVLSAAIPTLTKRSSSDREFIWRWTTQGNSTYFGVGSNQSAILGYSSHPASDSLIDELLTDPEETDTTTPDDGTRPEAGVVNVGDLEFSSSGDKLVLLKKTVQGSNSNFMNSHISFFTLPNSGSATTDDIEYAGRLTLDPGNIALGMGSLQRISEDNVGENTAIGHFALLRDTDGYRNTAIGKKTLSYNTTGAYNTAVGYASLFQLGKTDDTSTEANFENTAVGALSQVSTEGKYNTSVGAQSLARNMGGAHNTVIGRAALGRMTSGSYNTALGSGACEYITNGVGNICLGYKAGSFGGVTSDNYGLYIGTGADEAPLLSGHTIRTGDYDKELTVNALYVNFKPPYTTNEPSFQFKSMAGYDSGDDLGYADDAGEGQHAEAVFNLRDTGSADSTKSSVSLFFSAAGTTDTNKSAYIDAYDPYWLASANPANIIFNRMLKFDFKDVDSVATVSIKAEDYTESITYPLALNEALTIEMNDTTPELLLNSDGLTLTTSSSTIPLFYDNNTSSLRLIDDKIWITEDDITIDMDALNITSSQIAITASSGISIGDNIWIDDDISISGITGGSSGTCVKDNINDLWEKVNSLQQSTTSDARLKNISGDSTAGLKEINALEVKNFTYKNDEEKIPHVGVIAQQLQKVFPNSVTKDYDGYLKIRTEEIFYAMVNSIKELYRQIQDLTAKITGLDKRITELEQQNKLLLEQNKEFEKRISKLEKQSSK